MEDFAGLLMIPVLLMGVGVYFYSVGWAYRDAERRGKSGCLVAILVLLVSWPLGLIIWLVARPEEDRGRSEMRRPRRPY